MHFPNEKVIYEVPIYSMSQKEFQHRWENWKKKCYIRSEEMGHTREETENIVKSIMQGQYPRNVWKYNQIVGFVEIAVSSRDIAFYVHKTLDKRIRATGNTKHYIQDMWINGLHFPIHNMTNEEIVIEIDRFLDAIQKDLSNPLYLCRDVYNNIKNNIDFIGLM